MTFKTEFMKRSYLLIFVLLLLGFGSYGQDDGTTTTGAELTTNVENYSADFLAIAPDSRAGAMGDAGVAFILSIFGRMGNHDEHDPIFAAPLGQLDGFFGVGINHGNRVEYAGEGPVFKQDFF